MRARALAAAFDLHVLPARLATSADEAVAAAEALGWPVAAKLVSPHVEWKASVWPTALGVADAAALRTAFESARDALAAHRPTLASTGCWSSRCTRRVRSASSRSASAATRASGR